MPIVNIEQTPVEITENEEKFKPDPDALKITRSKTARGYSMVEYVDLYNKACSLQESSAAREEECVWLGINNPTIEVLIPGRGGWSPVPIPEDAVVASRMHLSRSQVAALIPELQYFVDTGRVYVPDPELLKNI